MAAHSLANGRTAPGPPSSSSSQQSSNSRRAAGTLSAVEGAAGSSGSRGRAGAAVQPEIPTPFAAPSSIQPATLLRLGVVLAGSPAASSSAASFSGSSGESSQEGLLALQEELARVREAAEARSRSVVQRRTRASSAYPRPAPPSASSSSLRSKLSPTASTSREKISSSNTATRPPTPLNASTLGTNNAINNAPPSRGVKRSRAQDSASDSSLSPQSATSMSSFEPTNSQNAPRPSSSRHTSPAVSTSTTASGVGLGLSIAKLSRAASLSKEGKEGSITPHSGTPSTSSSSTATSSLKDGKPLAIPGMGAPMPALPGFTKKKKLPPPQLEKPSSPAPTSRQFSPPSEPPRTASTSRLPPPPSSLPPRPASLPPKPVMAYVAPTSSSLHRRETSGTGSTSSRATEGNDRDRQQNRDKERERDRTISSNSNNNDRDQQQYQREKERDRRERSISKGKESERDSINNSYDSTQDSLKMSQQKGTASTSANIDELSSNHTKPPEPSPRLPEDEPPPPPPLPPPPEIEDMNTELSAPIIAIEDATPTPEPDSISKTAVSEESNETSPAVTATMPSTEETTAATSEKPSPQTQQSWPRKTLPPSSAATAITDSPASSPKGPAAPPSAVPANMTGGPPSRPNTPLGRKKLPASVTAAASRRASPAPTDTKGTASTPTTASTSAGQETSRQSPAPSSALLPSHPQPLQEGGKTSAGRGDVESLAALEAKQKRKEEKRKRKLAMLLANGSGGSTTPSNSVSSPKINGINGSPAIKVNGLSPSSSLRNDSMPPPSKLRRVDSATSIDSNDKTGLKLKLNGITLNRTKSATPAETPQQPVKKGPSIPGVADDFTPPTRALVPPPPAIHLPAPTPSKQSEINENFDNAKPSTQVPYTTFANWVNDFFRSFGEDDLAFLAPKPEDPGVYDIPPLGPHYQDTWAAMDAELNGEQVEGPPHSTALVPPALRRFKPQNLTTAALTTENIYLGPLGERLISAFKDTKDIRGIMDDLLAAQEEMQVDKANMDTTTILDPTNSAPGIIIQPTQQTGEVAYNTQISPQLLTPAMFNDPNTLAATPSIKEMDALDFESRLTRELSFLGIIPLPTRIVPPPTTTKPSKKTAESNTTQFDLSSSVDWSSRADDEISTALRACQRQLQKQVALNDKRKERLSSIVRRRIAYQEYEHLRDGLEAVIEGAWAKRQRAAQRKAQKDRKDKDKKGEREKDRDKLEAASLAQSIAALNTPQPLSATLVAALTKRRNLVDSVQPLFPPNAYVLPTESIFQGLDAGSAKDS